MKSFSNPIVFNANLAENYPNPPFLGTNPFLTSQNDWDNILGASDYLISIAEHIANL
jgi:hypothetical protein